MAGVNGSVTFFQVVAAAASLATVAALFVGVYFTGKRSNREEAVRWRDEHDVQKTARTRLEATLVEKDALAERDKQAIQAMGRRLEEKDQVISELGGTRVAEMLLTMQQESTKLFSVLTGSIESHEQRAAERHTELVKTLRNINGGGR